MGKSIIEYYRERCVLNLNTKTFESVWPIWKSKIYEHSPSMTVPREVFNLGDHLSEIFLSTNKESGNRSQSDVSGGGTAWEALVCWYLNLCLIGRNTVVIKHKKELIPDAVRETITVKYNNALSNTESDLIAITFPIDFDVPSFENKHFMREINQYCEDHLSNIEIHIIQCKTNWNDNAQIPMLWDMIYNSKQLADGVFVGTNGHCIQDIKRFSYSFITVPTNKLSSYKNSSVCVKRLSNLSGGNYWGRETATDIASSAKEMFDRNLRNGKNSSILESLKEELPKLHSEYSYFNI